MKIFIFLPLYSNIFQHQSIIATVQFIMPSPYFLLREIIPPLISATVFKNRGQNNLKNLTSRLKRLIFVIKNKLLPTPTRFDNGE